MTAAAAAAADLAALTRALGASAADGATAALGRIAGDPTLADVLRRHQLLSLVVATVPDRQLRALLPADTVAACRAWLARPRPSAEENLRTAVATVAALADVGIACMLLKGACFAARLYGGLERRAQYDVDLLVRRADARRAAAVLRRLGWTEQVRDLHSVTFARGAAQIDLHSAFRSAPAYRLDETRIWRDGVAATVGDAVFTTPSDEDTFVLLVLSLFQDVGLGAAKLRQVLDAALLAADVDARFDWAAFFARRDAEGTRAIAANVLTLVLRTLGDEASLPRLAAALAAERPRVAVDDRAEALGLVLGARGALANRAWFFRVYPGSIARYWLWLLPRKLSSRLRGRAPSRGPTAMRPDLATLRMLFAARRS